MTPKQQNQCSHPATTYNISPHASQVKYKRPSLRERLAAMKPTTPSSKLSAPPSRSDLDSFPAPLVLPWDDIALDPEYPPQSFQEWHDDGDRNSVTARRRTIYVVKPPGVEKEVSDVHSWAKPRHHESKDPILTSTPETRDVISYLSAFFHGLPVKHLKIPNWTFSAWIEDEPSSRGQGRGRSKRHKQDWIALTTATECIRIRARPSPDEIYPVQLNLDDLLDVAISILPKDAYALCILVHHDLYEDEDDTFVCGRAYGGSRVAVVSTARYNPLLDSVMDVERVHAWPASHCRSYIDDVCRREGGLSKKQKKGLPPKPGPREDGALEAALTAFSRPSPRPGGSGNEEPGLWLWRIVRTASHELCHCLGLDHCVYYACIMQGSASLSEDSRQPPYLCPVDLAKVLFATGSGVEERDRALLRYCEESGREEVAGFRAFAAWLRVSLGLCN